MSIWPTTSTFKKEYISLSTNLYMVSKQVDSNRTIIQYLPSSSISTNRVVSMKYYLYKYFKKKNVRHNNLKVPRLRVERDVVKRKGKKKRKERIENSRETHIGTVGRVTNIILRTKLTNRPLTFDRI